MPADSASRRAIKHIANRLLGQQGYVRLQGAAMAWDIRQGRWTEPELDLLDAALRSGDTAIDVGANYGLYSYHLARRVGPSGSVIAFEPVEDTSESLRLVMKLLRASNVHVIPAGCSDYTGTMTFDVPVQSSGAISAGQAHGSDRFDDRPGRERHVRHDQNTTVGGRVVTIDGWLSDCASALTGPVTLLKCDIEGAELSALRGAERLLANEHPTIICEVNPWFLEGYGLRTIDLVEYLALRDYEPYRYVPRHHRLVPTASEDMDEDNYVFIHPARADRLATFLK